MISDQDLRSKYDQARRQYEGGQRSQPNSKAEGYSHGNTQRADSQQQSYYQDFQSSDDFYTFYSSFSHKKRSNDKNDNWGSKESKFRKDSNFYGTQDPRQSRENPNH